MLEYRPFLNIIFTSKETIADSIRMQENTGEIKPTFWQILSDKGA